MCGKKVFAKRRKKKVFAIEKKKMVFVLHKARDEDEFDDDEFDEDEFETPPRRSRKKPIQKTINFYKNRRRCTCDKCKRRSAARKRHQRAAERSVFTFLLQRLKLDVSQQPAIKDAIAMCKSAKLDAKRIAELRRVLIRCEDTLNTTAFDEFMRFQPCERDPLQPHVVALFDHTLVQTSARDAKYCSGKHNMQGIKFLVVTSIQGTILRVVGPVPGSVHDYTHCKFDEVGGHPLPVHLENECCLADLGYVGCGGKHVRLPEKKPCNQDYTEEQNLWNRTIAKFRARVEHTFACFKRRFSFFAAKIHLFRTSNGQREQDDQLIGCLFKLACLYQAFTMHNGNVAFSKYQTCCNSYFREHDKHPKYPDLGKLCNCRVFPTLNEHIELQKAKIRTRMMKKAKKAAAPAKKSVKVMYGKRQIKQPK
jgi:hypothetical protein